MKKAKWILAVQLILISNLFSFDMSGTSFTEFVRFVSNTSNVNIIIDEKIDTKFSVIMPKDFNTKHSFKVLKSVLFKHDLYLSNYGSVYYIRKIEEVKKYYSIKLKYLIPSKIIPIINIHMPKMKISKSKKTIIFNSTKKEYKSIVNLVSLLDKETKSKKVKITLISYQKGDLLEFGVNIDLKYSNEFGDRNFQYKSFVDNINTSSSLKLNIPSFNIDFFISNLESKNIIDLKFSPTLSLFDNEITKFSITENIPFLSEDRSVNGDNEIESNSFQYKDVGSVIYIDKVAITDEELYFHISLDYEIIVEKTLTPSSAKRSIDNYIKLKNGESMMIAGIKGSELRTLHRKFPILGDIPYLGNLFKWDSESIKEETFAILISNVDSSYTYKDRKKLDDDCCIY